jgi:hypothetical protein
MRQFCCALLCILLVVGCIKEGIYYPNLTTISEEEVPDSVGLLTADMGEEVRELVLSFHISKRDDPNQDIDCVTILFGIASLLEGYGLAPIAIYIGDDSSGKGHALYVYRINSKFGSFGGGLFDNNEATFTSVEKLVRYVATKDKFYADSFDIFDIRVNYPEYDLGGELQTYSGPFENRLVPPVEP